MSVFKKFETGDVVIGRIRSVSEGLFPAGSSEWSVFYLNSDQSTELTGSSALDPRNGLYYFDIYSADPDLEPDTSELMFSVSYGSSAGTGSSDADRSTYKIFPTKAVYAQYKNILLSPDDTKFTFISGSGTGATLIDSTDIYVINFSSPKFKERLDAGVLEFSLSGNNGVITFVDDSPNESVKKSVYNIVRGSLATDSTDAVVNTPEGIGLFYPELGIVVLNPQKVSEIVGSDLSPVDGTTSYSLNHSKLATSIINGSADTSMKARSTELVPSRQFFVRVRNQEFNYSNNPTFVKDPDVTGDSSDEGEILYNDFYNDPHVFITSIGLYDENNDLIAVAKPSQPIEKTFDSEALIKIRLDV